MSDSKYEFNGPVTIDTSGKNVQINEGRLCKDGFDCRCMSMNTAGKTCEAARLRQERDELKALRKVYLDADPLICPECGPITSTDEDGLCHMCGCSVTHDEDGNVLDTAPNQFQRLRAQEAEAELSTLRDLERAQQDEIGGLKESLEASEAVMQYYKDGDAAADLSEALKQLEVADAEVKRMREWIESLVTRARIINESNAVPDQYKYAMADVAGEAETLLAVPAMVPCGDEPSQTCECGCNDPAPEPPDDH